MIASGRLRRRPKTSPVSHPGNGRVAAPMTTPIANRLINAPSIAARLSSNDSGIIVATAMAPKSTPQRTPSIGFDIRPPTSKQTRGLYQYICAVQAYTECQRLLNGATHRMRLGQQPCDHLWNGT